METKITTRLTCEKCDGDNIVCLNCHANTDTNIKENDNKFVYVLFDWEEPNPRVLGVFRSFVRASTFALHWANTHDLPPRIRKCFYDSRL